MLLWNYLGMNEWLNEGIIIINLGVPPYLILNDREKSFGFLNGLYQLLQKENYNDMLK